MSAVITNGVFDVLSPGHYNLLMYAREIAQYGKLTVLLDENDKVTADKGLNRPIFDVHERAKALLDLRWYDPQTEAMRPLVDDIGFFLTNMQLEMMIRRLKPDYIIKGSDWEGKKVVGEEYAKVLFFHRMEYSTTDIVKRVLDKHKV